ncbi:MAG: hypothetical protein ACREDQ_13620 [Limisphaerales bacterium]
MKTTKSTLFMGLWIALAAAVAGLLIARHPLAPPANREAKSRPVANAERPVATSSPAAIASKVLPSEAVSRPASTAILLPPERPKAPTNGQPQTVQAQAGQRLSYNGYEIQDPIARAALYSVGMDPEADAYWISAINDPSLPAGERKDLIEDLNETGLSNPHHPGPTDLPLILARIRLVERLAPYSLDQVDGAAFGEAYKDLVGMANGQAPP